MPTSIAYPLVNGVRHGFSSIEFKLAGQIFVGFKSIKYGRKRTRVEVRGNSPDPIAKTRGDNAYTGSCEMYLAEWNLFQSALIAAAKVAFGNTDGKGWGDVAFQTLVTYNENGFDTIIDTLNGCTADEISADQQQNPDPLVRMIDLAPLKILFNGVDDLAQPLTAPPGG